MAGRNRNQEAGQTCTSRRAATVGAAIIIGLAAKRLGGFLAGHTLRFVACLVSQGAQIPAIRHSGPFVLV